MIPKMFEIYTVYHKIQLGLIIKVCLIRTEREREERFIYEERLQKRHLESKLLKSRNLAWESLVTVYETKF